MSVFDGMVFKRLKHILKRNYKISENYQTAHSVQLLCVNYTCTSHLKKPVKLWLYRIVINNQFKPYEIFYSNKPVFQNGRFWTQMVKKQTNTMSVACGCGQQALWGLKEKWCQTALQINNRSAHNKHQSGGSGSHRKRSIALSGMCGEEWILPMSHTHVHTISVV